MKQLDEQYKPVQGCPPFDALEPESISNLLGACAFYRILGRGKSVFNEGQPTRESFILCKGLVKLTKLLHDGNEVIVDILKPCEVIDSCPDDEVHEYSALSMTEEIHVAALETDTLGDLCRQDSEVARVFVTHRQNRLCRAYRLLSAMRLPMNERLIAVIRYLGEVLGSKSDVEVSVPMTLAELAQLVQTTPESISRWTRGLRDQGIIDVASRNLVIHRDKAAQAYANFGRSR